MTTKDRRFHPPNGRPVLEGPPTAGLIVITASRGGMFRETMAMSKAYSEARAQHGESELLDEIVAAKPRMERGKAPHSRGAQGSGPSTACETRRRCWNTRRPPRSAKTTGASCSPWPARSLRPTGREGKQVSPAEQQAIQDITTALSTDGS